MEKLTIILGGPVGIYQYNLKFFDAFEKKFKCKIMRNSEFSFSTKIKKTKVEFLFCFNPKRDKNYNLLKKYLAIEQKELMPPPSEVLAKRIKGNDPVLFFGLCGGFKGKIDQVYLPTQFKELNFGEDIIRHKVIEKLKPRKPITRKNILVGKIKGKKARIVTTNLTLAPKNVEKESMNHVRIMANKLLKHADAVEKETYQIAKNIDKKTPLGLLVVASDVLHKEKYMLNLKLKRFKLNKDLFNHACHQAIEMVMEKF